MKKLLGFFLGVSVFSIVFFPFEPFVNTACAQGELNPKLKQLLELSGIQKFVDNYGENFLTGIRSQMPIGGFGELETLAYDAFEPAKIYAVFNEEFQSQWNEDFVGALIAKFQQPFFQKFQEKEDYLNTEQGAAEFNEYQQNFLVNNYVSQDRIEMIKKLLATTGVADSAIEVTSSMMRAMFLASNAVADIDAQVTEKEIDDQLAEFKEKTRPQMLQSLLMRYLFAYSDFSDEDLQNYVAFNESAEAQWLIKHFNSALFKAIRKCGDEFTVGLIKLAKTKQEKSKSE